MTDYELLDMIGEVNEDYVLAADSNVVRPRFRWKALAACAACAALALGAYSAYQAANPPLHGCTLMENSADSADTVKEWDDLAKAPAEGAQDGPAADSDVDEVPPVLSAPTAPEAASGWTDRGGGKGEESAVGGGYDSCDGTLDTAPAPDIPMQEAALWYDALLHTMRLEENPEWFGGAWIAGDQLLAVAIVNGFRTAELEAEIQKAAGDGAVLQFSTVKYSMGFLYGLMEPATRALDGAGLTCGIGVDVAANCLGVDLYGVEDVVPDDILARLAHLDPGGDAIRVRVFPSGELSLVPSGGALATPSPGGRREAPDDSAGAKEGEQPAHYDLLPGGE